MNTDFFDEEDASLFFEAVVPLTPDGNKFPTQKRSVKKLKLQQIQKIMY